MDNLRAFADALIAYDGRMTKMYLVVPTAEEFDRRLKEDAVRCGLRKIGSLVIYSDRIIVEQVVLDQVGLRRSDAAAALRD